MEMQKFKSIWLIMLMAFVGATNVSAQTEQEKMMAGVWKFNGYTNAKGEKYDMGKNFSAVKIYNPDGEYCFAQFYIYADGTVDVKPHDYGTWSYKNGQYMECGRKGEIISLTKKEFRSKDSNSHAPSIPARLNLRSVSHSAIPHTIRKGRE